MKVQNLTQIGMILALGLTSLHCSNSASKDDKKADSLALFDLIMRPCNDPAIRAAVSLKISSSPSVQPQYFGYFASEQWVDEVKDHTNVVWVGSIDGLRRAHEAHQKAVFVLSMFDGDDKAMTFSRRSDWREYWSQTAKTIRDSGLENTIVMYYPLDEPDMQAAKFKYDLARLNYELDEINQLIKQPEYFPNAKTGVIYNGGGVYLGMQIPSSFDWVGQDQYKTFFHFIGQNVKKFEKPFRDFMRDEEGAICTLFLSMHRHQKIMLVPQTFSTPTYLASESELRVDLQASYQIAQQYPVVAIFPFLWEWPVDTSTGRRQASACVPDHAWDENTPTARTLPELQKDLKALGKTIRSKSPETWSN